jgi:hypothetical protein
MHADVVVDESSQSQTHTLDSVAWQNQMPAVGFTFIMILTHRFLASHPAQPLSPQCRAAVPIKTSNTHSRTADRHQHAFLDQIQFALPQ